MPRPGPISGILFDLDGTLLDTAPDLVAAINAALTEAGLPPCPAAEAKPFISGGARTMLGYWLVKTVEQRPVYPYPQANAVSPANQPLFNRLMDRMLDAIAKGRASITAHPARTLGIAALVGAVLARGPVLKLAGQAYAAGKEIAVEKYRQYRIAKGKEKADG